MGKLTLSQYQLLSHEILDKIVSLLDNWHLESNLECEYFGDAIRICYNDRVILINKHSPTMQIWLSSPVSGGIRFSYDLNSSNWIGKDGEELISFLKKRN